MAEESDPEAVRAYFLNFGGQQAPLNGSPLYQVLALGAADDSDMIALAAVSPPTQPAANLLLAAVHFLLLDGAQDPLREFYPDVVQAAARPATPEAYVAFREFVWAQRGAIEPLLRSRLVQTNVVRRTTTLLPAFAAIARAGGDRPLALVEIGCSGGLNLLWDRYQHRLCLPSGAVQTWGPTDSPLTLETEVRSSGRLPELGAELRVGWRVGIDLHPIATADPDELRWLRALIFPEHRERHTELEAAAAIARLDPPRLVQGDAVQLAAPLAAEAPEDATLVFYASMVLNQIPSAGRAQLREQLTELSRSRPVALLTLGGNVEGFAGLRLERYCSGSMQKSELGTAHAHGRWLDWQAQPL